VGLTGEVRAISQIDKRIIEAKRLGFNKFILPAGNKKQSDRVNTPGEIELLFAKTVDEALSYLF